MVVRSGMWDDIAEFMSMSGGSLDRCWMCGLIYAHKAIMDLV